MAGFRLAICAFLPLSCCIVQSADEVKVASSRSVFGTWCKRKPNHESKDEEDDSLDHEMSINDPTEECRLAHRTTSMPELRHPPMNVRDRINGHPEDTVIRWKSYPILVLSDKNAPEKTNRLATRTLRGHEDTASCVVDIADASCNDKYTCERLCLFKSLPFAGASSLSLLKPSMTEKENLPMSNSSETKSIAFEITPQISSSEHVSSESSSLSQNLEPVVFRDQVSIKGRNTHHLPTFSTLIAQRPVQSKRNCHSHRSDSLTSDEGLWRPENDCAEPCLYDEDIQAWESPPRLDVPGGSSVFEYHRTSDRNITLPSPLYQSDENPLVPDVPQIESLKPVLTEPMRYTPPIKPRNVLPSKPQLAVCTWHPSNGRTYLQQLRNIDEAEKKISNNAWLNMMMNRFGLNGGSDCLGLLSKQDLVQRRESAESQP